VLTDADADAFDAAVGRWLMGLARPISVPGAGGCGDSPALMQVGWMARRSAVPRTPRGNQSHLLAALVGPDAATSVVAAQAEVGPKTNEVPMAAAVLSQIDLNNKIVTADALHTVKATATHIHQRGGQFVFPVKENRRALFDALAWKDVPIAHRSTDTGHARITNEVGTEDEVNLRVLAAFDELALAI
jgi:predicted transposase YbfD/YdcC